MLEVGLKRGEDTQGPADAVVVPPLLHAIFIFRCLSVALTALLPANAKRVRWRSEMQARLIFIAVHTS